MQSYRKRRLYFILILIISLTIASALVLYALRNNINLYYTPQQLLLRSVKPKEAIRIGGLVKTGSVHHLGHSLGIRFVMTDFHNDVTVYYWGVLPALFREGQGIVARGVLTKKGTFMANQILAKHDENYHPPGIKIAKTMRPLNKS